jgi:hypothetical protein
MKKSVLYLPLIFILAVSCEKNEPIKENLILPEYEYIDDLEISGDILWVISSKPQNFLDFVLTLAPNQISKINLNDGKILAGKIVPHCVSIATDKDNQSFLATSDKKILKIKPDLSTEELFSIPGINSIRMMLCDENNDLWIATDDGGLYLYDGKDTIRYNSYNSILKNNWIPSIAMDSESNIWFLQGMDLFKIDHTKTLIKDPYQIPIDKPTGVFDLSSDRNNTLFGSKWDGNYHNLLKKESGKPWTIINPPTSSDKRPVKFIKSDNYGTIWICYSDYPKDILAYLENDIWVDIDIPLDEVRIMDVETYTNKIFFGTSKGIYSITR